MKEVRISEERGWIGRQWAGGRIRNCRVQGSDKSAHRTSENASEMLGIGAVGAALSKVQGKTGYERWRSGGERGHRERTNQESDRLLS